MGFLRTFAVRLKRAYRGFTLQDYRSLKQDAELMAKAGNLIDDLTSINAGLQRSVGLLEEDNEEGDRTNMVMLGSVLAASGGSVRVPREVYDAVRVSDISVDCEGCPENSLIFSLGDRKDEQEEDECDNGCHCGPVS